MTRQTEFGIAQPFAGLPCGHFNSINHDFNYYQALMNIYLRPEIRNHIPNKELTTTFSDAVDRACQLIELLDGPLGVGEYYRFVHDNTICSLATTSLWIVDHWSAMSPAEAARSQTALKNAFLVTQTSQSLWQEQSAYLHKLLKFCCKKITYLSGECLDLAGESMLENNESNKSRDKEEQEQWDAISWILSLLPSSTQTAKEFSLEVEPFSTLLTEMYGTKPFVQ